MYVKKKSKNLKKVVVTGCLAQRYKKEILKNIPEVDIVLGIGANKSIAKILKSSFTSEIKIESFPAISEFSMEGGRSNKSINPISPFAYVKIADGCDNRCSYCAIPLIRGSFRSRKQENILNEVRMLARNGIKEVNLIAQDTTNYGLDIYGKSKLPELVSEISKIDNIKWIRILYCYPDHITDMLLDEISNNSKVVKYLDIPLQHVNIDLLKQMNRKGSNETISTLICKIRKKIPNIIIRTTFIIGFPGETDAQFKELCNFIKINKFERLGCFSYSREEDTPASKLPNQIKHKLKNTRMQLLVNEQSLVIDKFSKSLVGKYFDVLVEKVNNNGKCEGRTYMDAPEVDGMVHFNSKSAQVGDFVKVRIEDYKGYELFGSIKES